MKDDSIAIPLGKVDATVETNLAGDHGVSGYPTLKYFFKGSSIKYYGPLQADGIVEWVKFVNGGKPHRR